MDTWRALRDEARDARGRAERRSGMSCDEMAEALGRVLARMPDPAGLAEEAMRAAGGDPGEDRAEARKAPRRGMLRR